MSSDSSKVYVHNDDDAAFSYLKSNLDQDGSKVDYTSQIAWLSVLLLVEIIIIAILWEKYKNVMGKHIVPGITLIILLNSSSTQGRLTNSHFSIIYLLFIK